MRLLFASLLIATGLIGLVLVEMPIGAGDSTVSELIDRYPTGARVAEGLAREYGVSRAEMERAARALGAAEVQRILAKLERMSPAEIRQAMEARSGRRR